MILSPPSPTRADRWRQRRGRRFISPSPTPDYKTTEAHLCTSVYFDFFPIQTALSTVMIKAQRRLHCAKHQLCTQQKQLAFELSLNRLSLAAGMKTIPFLQVPSKTSAWQTAVRQVRLILRKPNGIFKRKPITDDQQALGVRSKDYPLHAANCMSQIHRENTPKPGRRKALRSQRPSKMAGSWKYSCSAYWRTNTIQKGKFKIPNGSGRTGRRSSSRRRSTDPNSLCESLWESKVFPLSESQEVTISVNVLDQFIIFKKECLKLPPNSSRPTTQ